MTARRQCISPDTGGAVAGRGVGLALVIVAAALVLTACISRPASAYLLNGSGWDGIYKDPAALSYYFVNGTPDLPIATQQAEVLRALNVWSTYADLTWSPAPAAGQNFSIDVGWFTGHHGDAQPFDGPGGQLAHGFYPPNLAPEPRAGDLHLDDAETWIAGYSGGTSLFSVALHELGHALGIAHSGDDKAIMYGTWAGGAYGNALSPDDIAAIRAQYAARYPTLSAHVWGRHTRRGDLIIRVGVTNAPGNAPLWQTDVHLRAGGDLDDFDYDEIDLSGGAAWFGGGYDWFVSIDDEVANETGLLDGFTLRWGTPGDWTIWTSPDAGPLADDGSTTAYVLDVVPEPTTAALLLLGGLALAAAAGRRGTSG